MPSSNRAYTRPSPPRGRRRRVAVRSGAVLGTLAVVVLAACGEDDTDATGRDRTTTTTTTTTTTATTTATNTATAGTEVPDTASAGSTAAAASGDEEAIQATRSLFADLPDDEPGCTIAVGRDGEVIYAEAFGAARLDPLEPMTTETIVDIGSTSKQFTATAILLLAEDGLLHLDDPLAEHLPALPGWATDTTLRQLMHHTSGIPDYIGLLLDDGVELTGTSTDSDALEALSAVTELDFEPGTEWAYSNSNYFLLGQVVFAVGGVPLDEFLDTEVFGPLGLEMVMDPVAALPGKAVSYEGTGDGRSIADSRWEQLGDGGIQTTPSELVRWAEQYWRPTVGGESITAARLDDAVDIVDPADPAGTVYGRYGAGIEISDDAGLGTVLSHAGGWGGFVTAFVVVPDDRFALAATCTSPDSLARIGLTGDDQLLEPWTNPD